jgi:hypothetical protein
VARPSLSGITRYDLDLVWIAQQLLKDVSYTEIAARETERLGKYIDRGTVAGIDRDLKSGALPLERLVQPKPDAKWIKTYIWGVEDHIDGGLPLFTGQMKLEGDAAVGGDTHSPFMDYKFAEAFRTWAEYYGLKRGILAGDVFDGNSQNTFRKKTRGVPLSLEFKMFRALLRYWLEWFEELIYLPGNHCDWLLYNMDGQIETTDYYNMLGLQEFEGRIIFTPYDNLTLHSGSENWFIAHQKEASVDPWTVGDGLAQKFQMNVVVPHQHNNVLSSDRYGRYTILGIGGMFDPAKLSYIGLKTTKRGVPQQGFGMIKDGCGHLITPYPRMTDWKVLSA